MVPPTIRHQLARLCRRERILRLLWGAARWLALALAALALACLTDWLIDRYRDTPVGLRQGLLGGQIVLAALAGWFFVIRPVLRKLGDRWAALWAEEKVPTLGHRLISAVQLNRPDARTDGMSAELIAVVTREAEEQSSRLNFARLADHRRLKWAAAAALPPVLMAGGLLAAFPETVWALLERQALRDREVPRSVRLEPVAAETVVPAGEEAVVRFRATGEVAQEMRGEVCVEVEGEPAVRYPLTRESAEGSGAAVFAAKVPPSAATLLTCSARLKDARSRQSALVRFEPPPTVVELNAWARLPTYCGTRPDGSPYEQFQPRGDIAALPGCSARVAAKAQKPVHRATLELLGTPAENAPEQVLRRIDMNAVEDGSVVEAVFDLRPDESAYRVLVEDQYGFQNPSPPRRGLRILADEPPRVALLPEQFPGGEGGPAEDFEVEGVPVPLDGSIRLAYTCSSPLGLRRARLRYRVNESEDWVPLPLKEVAATEQTGPFDPRRGAFANSAAGDQVEFHAVPSSDADLFPGRLEGGGRFDFQTRGLSLKVGDKIEFYVEVFDQNPAPDRPAGRSETRIKGIVTPPEVEAWVRLTLQEESRIRQLEKKQRDVFGRGSTDDDPATTREPVVVTVPPPPPPMAATTPFVRDWQLVGPFPNPDDKGFETAYPPETEPTDLGREFDGLKGKVRWQPHRGETDLIDLEKFFSHGKAGVAYAVCWVNVPGATRAVLATGSDDGIQVWLDRKKVLSKRVHREAVAGDDTTPVDLRAGWNEVLVKVDNRFGTWAFYLELRDPATGKTLRGLTTQTTQPEEDARRFVRDWQLLGPFPNRNGTGRVLKYPPEREPFDATKKYDGLTGQVPWRLHHSDKGKIDLEKFYARPAQEWGVAYAICWVRNPTPREVVFSTGSRDGLKVWLDRKLILDKDARRAAVAASESTRVQLAAGWNEVLLKVDHRGDGGWAFYFELRDPNTGRPLEGVEVRATPPPSQKVTARFLREWQVVGPFANPDKRGFTTAFPPEAGPTDLGKEFAGLKGKVRWQLVKSDDDRIDLGKILNHHEAGIAYAVCWVRSDKARPVRLRLGSDDGIKVFVNRRSVFAKDVNRPAAPAQDTVRADLKAGWNEVLVKVSNHAADWEFYLELLDPVQDVPPSGVEYRTTPPVKK